MKIPETMLAANLEAKGVIKLVEKPVPTPGPAEVLIRIEACGVCGGDLKVRDIGLPGQPPFGEPFTVGHEYAGVVVQCGPTVDEFAVGDRVVVEVHKGCGRCQNCLMGNYTACLNFGNKEKGHRANGFTSDGGFAEYAVNHINSVVKIPEGISFDQAILITTAGTALYAFDQMGGYIAGDTVVIVGPGPIGLCLVAAAKALGAENVVLVGTRKSRLDVGKKLGADYLVNCSEGEDSVALVKELTGGVGADVVCDAAGAATSLDTCLNLVRPAGDVVLVAMYKKPVTADLGKAVKHNVQLHTIRGEGRLNVHRALSLMGQGKLNLDPLLTHSFSLSQIDQAFETFEKRIDNAIKVVVHPQEK